MILVSTFTDQLQQINQWLQKDVIVFMFYRQFQISKEIRLEKNGEKYKNKILLALEKTIMPELKKNLEVCFYMTPENFKNDYLSTYGSGFSISPIFKQSAWFRFHNKSEDFKNLYFTGAGSHPGAGVPGVVSSAKIIENLILNENK